MQRLPLFLASLIVSLAVLANAAGSFFSHSNPNLALSLNPLDVDARMRQAELAIGQKGVDAPLPSLRSLIENGVALEPYNASLYGLLGILNELEEKPKNLSAKLYEHALLLDKTELRSLLRGLSLDVNDNNVTGAMAKTELIFRAWPQHWETIEPLVPVLLSSKKGYETARESFKHLPGGPTRMLTSLAKSDAGLEIARRLLLDWRTEGLSNLEHATHIIIGSLIGAGRSLDAFLLHGLTISQAEQAHSGFIFNSDFELQPAGSPFDWRLPKVSGANFDIVSRNTINKTDGSMNSDRALEIRFLDTPIRLNNRLLLIRVPESQMNWVVSYSTRSLRGPKPIQLKIQCRAKPKILQTITLTPVEDGVREVKLPVSIPGKDCDLQEIWVTNGNAVESWQNRYAGSVFLHKVELQPDG